MRATRSLVPLLALACTQEINIKPEDSDVPVPVDTEIAVPVGQPSILVTPNKLSFGDLPPDCEAQPQVFTVENVGDARLEVGDFDFVGPIASYTVTPPGGFRLAPGESKDVTVTFTPATYTTYNVRVNIPSNDPAKPTARVGLSGTGAQAAFHEEVFLQEQADKVDVLWVIDQSCSMSENLTTVANALDRFIQSFVNLGLDYHIGVTTVDMTAEAGDLRGPWIDASTPNGTSLFKNQVDAGAGGLGEETGFAAAKAAIVTKANSGYNQGFLRADATLAVVVVSDEDDRDADSDGGLAYAPGVTNNFVAWLDGMKADPGDTSFSALTCLSNTRGAGCPEYKRAIQATGGVWGNIDRRPIDINPFLTHLSFVAAGLDISFELADTPTNTSPSAVTVTVNGQAVPFDPSQQNGWTYDADTNSIVFWGAAIPDPGEAIVIRYPYDAGC